MSTRLDFDDYPGLFTAERRLEQTVLVLRSALKELEGGALEGGWGMRGSQLQSIAARLHGAATDIAVVAGWNQAACEAVEQGSEVTP